MNKQKKATGLGLLFLIAIVVYVALSFMIQLLSANGINMSSNLLLVVGELAIAVPGIIYIFIKKISLRDGAGFKKIKGSTFLLCVLLGFLIMPIASFVNLLTQFFVSNIMVEASEELLEGSALVLILISGFIGPLCEEFIFRGIFHREYDRITKPIRAILISALFFGVMHLNFNQFCYAFVIGIFLAVVNKVTNSIYPSITIHVIINTVNVGMLVISDYALKMTGADASIAESSEAFRSNTAYLIMMTSVYFVAAVICTVIFALVVIKIARIEGTSEVLKNMFTFKKKVEEPQDEEKLPRILFNVPTIIVLIVGCILMFGILPG